MTDARSTVLLAAFLVWTALGGASCSKQPSYTIPVCSVDSTSADCHCDTKGWILCNHICVNGQGDPNNCGTCGASCPGQVCSSGVCKDRCDVRQCGSACSTDDDPLNCGGCGNQCEGPCTNGACEKKLTYKDCKSGEELCNNKCINFDSDPLNCGGCGMACPRGNGGCVLRSCCVGTGMKACSYCVDTTMDSLNCGDCGHQCRFDERCSSSKCVPL